MKNPALKRIGILSRLRIFRRICIARLTLGPEGPRLRLSVRSIVPRADFHVMDIEKLNFPKNTFNGAWASASFLHLSKKNLMNVFNTIHSFLKPNGVFYLSVKKGVGETLTQDERYGKQQKFWSFFERTLSRNLGPSGPRVRRAMQIRLKILKRERIPMRFSAGFFKNKKLIHSKEARFNIMVMECTNPTSTYETHPMIRIFCKRGEA